MKRIGKHEGIGNVVVEDAPVPEIGPREILVRNVRTLISRGSEIGRRYLHPGEIDPAIMGYSAAGYVAAVGTDVTEYLIGQRVAIMAPHAEYVVGDVDRDDGSWITPIPDSVTFDAATFHPLVIGALTWAKISAVQPHETVVILGQGLVGALVLQAVRAYKPERLIAVDALDHRRALATQFGADVVIDAATEDPVARVKELTGGDGAHVVIDCVGGKAGVVSFAQGLDMCRPLGRIHLIALYHGEPLPLDAGKIQSRLLIGGYYTEESRKPFADWAMAAIDSGEIQVDPMITHHFSFTQAKEAFDILYHRPGEAFGVLLDWPD
jgi:threonine dehydrogenase-like Zn-dependent dehydrogenase